MTPHRPAVDQSVTASREPSRYLSDRHLADLARSGITAEQALAAGWHTITDPAEISRILRWERPATRLGACLCIPFRGPDGGLIPDYARLRPDKPRKTAKGEDQGKPIKYESPIGQPNRAYFPPDVVAVLSDPSTELVVTEGEKKALSAAVRGIPAIGLVGVWGFVRKREKDADGNPVGDRRLIPDLEAVAWAGLKVNIVYDSDSARNPHVGQAAAILADLLIAQGAEVHIVNLPDLPGPDGAPAKCGLDDYLVTRPVDEFRALVARTPPCVRPSDTQGEPGCLIVDGVRLTEGGYTTNTFGTYKCDLERDDDTGELKITKRQKLANFNARVLRTTVRDDGAEQERLLTLEVSRHQAATATVHVLASRFGTLGRSLKG